MSVRLLALVVVGGLAVGVRGADRPVRDPAESLFGPDKLWTAHLEISAKDWEAMHPTRGMRFFGAPAFAPPREPGKENPVPVPGRGGFGFDFDYVKGTLEFDGKKYPNVGIRFKGNSSYAMAAQTLKRPFKIDFDRYSKDGSLQGLRMINLANNLGDPSQLRESLGYSVFRSIGVPAPRTAFVELSLTVPGKHDRVLLGVYTLIEQVDRNFLENHFKKGKGMLLKPEGIQNLPYLGQDWQPYEELYRPKKDPTAAEKRRLQDFTRLVNFADDATFEKTIAQFMDVDRFLRYVAACSAMVNLDSFVGLGHNYYLYLNPVDNRFVWIPWDLNGTLCGILLAGSVEQQQEWSIRRPYLGSNRLVERLLASKDHEASYRKYLRELTARGFKPEVLHGQIDRMQQTIDQAVAREVKTRKPAPGGVLGAMATVLTRPPDPRQFVTRRVESLHAQLDGKAEGKEVGGAFGGPWGRVELSKQLGKPLLTALDSDRDSRASWEEVSAGLTLLFQQCDRGKAGTITEKALAEGIAKIWPKPSGWFARPPGGTLAGTAPGTHLAGLVFTRAGVREDRLSLKDLLAVAEPFFRAGDRGKDGKLEESELSKALNALPPIPAVFGRPPAPAKPAESGKKP